MIVLTMKYFGAYYDKFSRIPNGAVKEGFLFTLLNNF